MGIVHTVRSRIELWRLERYTKRRTCQLPGYSYKGKNERSNGGLFMDGFCVSSHSQLPCNNRARAGQKFQRYAEGKEQRHQVLRDIQSILAACVGVKKWNNPAGWPVQKCHSVSANTESMDRNDIFYPYSLSNKSKSQRTLA